LRIDNMSSLRTLQSSCNSSSQRDDSSASCTHVSIFELIRHRCEHVMPRVSLPPPRCQSEGTAGQLRGPPPFLWVKRKTVGSPRMRIAWCAAEMPPSSLQVSFLIPHPSLFRFHPSSLLRYMRP
jgi:hypothetical protein